MIRITRPLGWRLTRFFASLTLLAGAGLMPTPSLASVSPIGANGLQVSQTSSGFPEVGLAMDYTLTVTNTTSADATGVFLGATLPAGATLAAVPNPTLCERAKAGVAPGFTCSVGTLPGGASSSLTYTVTPTVAGPALNTAVAQGTVGTLFSTVSVDLTRQVAPSGTPVPTGPDLAAHKSHTGNFTVGTNGTYSLTVANVGNGPTTAPVTLTDTLPAGLGYVSATGAGWSCSAVGQTVTCTTPGPIAQGTTSSAVALDVSVAAAAAPHVINAASASTAGDTNSTNDATTDLALVSPAASVGAPDLALHMTHTGSFTVGVNNTYTLAVNNVGTASTTGSIGLTDTLPAGLSFVSATGTGWTCSASGQAVSCANAGPIAAAASSTLTLTVGVAAAAVPSVTNTASVSTAGDVNATNDAASDATVVNPAAVPDLAMAESCSTPFVVGSNGTCSLTVNNAGSGATTAPITITDVLPAGLAYVSGAGTGWTCSVATQTVTCSDAGPIAAAGSAQVTLTVTAAAAAAPSVSNTACVATTGDTNTANNCATQSVVVNVASTVSPAVVLLAQPQRVVDTRTGSGFLGAGQPLQGVTTPVCFTLAGAGGVPLTAVGLVLNATTIGAPIDGYITLYPGGQPIPATSTLNFSPAETAVANNSTVRIGANGQVCAVGVGGAQLILDAVGYLTDASATAQVQLLGQPARLVDTRAGSGFLGAGSPLQGTTTPNCYTLAGAGGIPTTATGALLNVTVTGQPGVGYATVYPAGGAIPPTSNVNFAPGELAIANGGMVKLGTNGQVCAIGLAGTQLIVDAVGYLTRMSATDQIQLLTQPTRLVDTRAGSGFTGAGQPLLGLTTPNCYTLAGAGGIPTTATGALINVTVTGQPGVGYATVYPAGAAIPATSNVNFAPGEPAIANGATVKLGTGGQVCVVGLAGTQLILDAVGYLAN